MKKKKLFFVSILKVTEEKSRIRKSLVRVRGSVSYKNVTGFGPSYTVSF
jgi:hypothetical protein